MTVFLTILSSVLIIYSLFMTYGVGYLYGVTEDYINSKQSTESEEGTN